jgi:hypothetical protein
MSIAAENLPPPPRRAIKKNLPLPLPRRYSKKGFDFQGYDSFELELLLLIDQIC